MGDSTYQLLSQLWLHEPDAETLVRVRAWQSHPSTATATSSGSAQDAASLHTNADPATLAAAYADLFLLNVYPYGTAYTDAWGELNTSEAQQVADLFAAHGYTPRELREVGAPDHLGLCLGFIGQFSHTSLQAERALPLPAGEGWGEGELFLSNLLHWAPVCCLAAERDPSAHAFYCALARLTRETLLADSQLQSTYLELPPSTQHSALDTDELRLRDVVRYLLAPARCGLFLSRARFGQIANHLGMRLPFGSRFEVCEWLFASAGERERVTALLHALRAECDAWARAYRAWSAQFAAWQPHGAQWLARVGTTEQLLQQMQTLSLEQLDLTYANPASDA